LRATTKKGRQPTLLTKKCIRVTWLEDFLASKWPGSFTALGPPLRQGAYALHKCTFTFTFILRLMLQHRWLVMFVFHVVHMWCLLACGLCASDDITQLGVFSAANDTATFSTIAHSCSSNDTEEAYRAYTFHFFRSHHASFVNEK